MKKKLLVLSLAAMPAVTFAQSSVVLYGVVDTGYQYLTNADKAGASSQGIVTNGYLPSRFGFKGSEDLGGGLSAIFQLESGFNSATGQLSPDPTVLFSRLANVGLKTPYGSLTFGRQYGVQFDKTVLYDPAYLVNYSVLSLTTIPVATLRINNSVKFQSETFSGFNVDAEYGFGQELPGNTVAGRYIGTALEYVNGPFATSLVYEQTRGSVTAAADQSSRADNRFSWTVRYAPERYSISGGLTRITGDLQLTPRGTAYWLGARAVVRPDVQFYALAGRYEFDSAKGHPTLLLAGGQYLLSKATMLYCNVGTMRNQGGSDFGLVSYSLAGQPGKSQAGVSVGIDHKF